MDHQRRDDSDRDSSAAPKRYSLFSDQVVAAGSFASLGSLVSRLSRTSVPSSSLRSDIGKRWLSDDEISILLRDACSKLGFRNFRSEQVHALRQILQCNDDVLAIFPTGFGKSTLFFAPFVTLPTGKVLLVIVPTVSLVNDHYRAAQCLGVNAIAFEDAITARNKNSKLLEGLRSFSSSCESLICFMTPEKIVKSPPTLRVFSDLLRTGCLAPWVVFDEAHCVCQWGMTFRPTYITAVEKLSDQLGGLYGLKIPRFVCITATCGTRVEYLLKKVFSRQNFTVSRVIGRRANYQITVARSSSFLEQQSVLVEDFIGGPGLRGRAIVYVATRADVGKIHDILIEAFASRKKEDQRSVYMYHRHLEGKVQQQQSWTDDPRGIMVGTTAFGFGINVWGISFVAVFGTPLSLDVYTQLIGRAARGPNESAVVKLYPHSFDLRNTTSLLAEVKDDAMRLEMANSYKSMIRFVHEPICRRVILGQIVDESPHAATCQDAEIACDVCSGAVKNIVVLKLYAEGQAILDILGGRTEVSFAQFRDWLMSKDLHASAGFRIASDRVSSLPALQNFPAERRLAALYMLLIRGYLGLVVSGTFPQCSFHVCCIRDELGLDSTMKWVLAKSNGALFNCALGESHELGNDLVVQGDDRTERFITGWKKVLMEVQGRCKVELPMDDLVAWSKNPSNDLQTIPQWNDIERKIPFSVARTLTYAATNWFDAFHKSPVQWERFSSGVLSRRGDGEFLPGEPIEKDDLLILRERDGILVFLKEAVSPGKVEPITVNVQDSHGEIVSRPNCHRHSEESQCEQVIFKGTYRVTVLGCQGDRDALLPRWLCKKHQTTFHPAQSAFLRQMVDKTWSFEPVLFPDYTYQRANSKSAYGRPSLFVDEPFLKKILILGFRNFGDWKIISQLMTMEYNAQDPPLLLDEERKLDSVPSHIQNPRRSQERIARIFETAVTNPIQLKNGEWLQDPGSEIKPLSDPVFKQYYKDAIEKFPLVKFDVMYKTVRATKFYDDATKILSGSPEEDEEYDGSKNVKPLYLAGGLAVTVSGSGFVDGFAFTQSGEGFPTLQRAFDASATVQHFKQQLIGVGGDSIKVHTKSLQRYWPNRNPPILYFSDLYHVKKLSTQDLGDSTPEEKKCYNEQMDATLLYARCDLAGRRNDDSRALLTAKFQDIIDRFSRSPLPSAPEKVCHDRCLEALLSRATIDEPKPVQYSPVLTGGSLRRLKRWVADKEFMLSLIPPISCGSKSIMNSSECENINNQREEAYGTGCRSPVHLIMSTRYADSLAQVRTFLQQTNRIDPFKYIPENLLAEDNAQRLMKDRASLFSRFVQSFYYKCVPKSSYSVWRKHPLFEGLQWTKCDMIETGQLTEVRRFLEEITNQGLVFNSLSETALYGQVAFPETLGSWTFFELCDGIKAVLASGAIGDKNSAQVQTVSSPSTVDYQNSQRPRGTPSQRGPKKHRSESSQ